MSKIILPHQIKVGDRIEGRNAQIYEVLDGIMRHPTNVKVKRESDGKVFEHTFLNFYDKIKVLEEL